VTGEPWLSVTVIVPTTVLALYITFTITSTREPAGGVNAADVEELALVVVLNDGGLDASSQMPAWDIGGWMTTTIAARSAVVEPQAPPMASAEPDAGLASICRAECHTCEVAASETVSANAASGVNALVVAEAWSAVWVPVAMLPAGTFALVVAVMVEVVPVARP
jgi:hypothetical protein